MSLSTVIFCSVVKVSFNTHTLDTVSVLDCKTKSCPKKLTLRNSTEIYYFRHKPITVLL